jgi:transposase
MKLSNPLRTKAIAEAPIKTDRIDAKTLAYLLRGNLVAESYVPTRKNREHRALIRHRANLIQMRVDVKNRIHAILDKHERSHTYIDLFGKQALEWLHNLQLTTPDHEILQFNRALIVEQIRVEVHAQSRHARKHVLFIDPYGTSQFCHQCLAWAPKNLAEREHRCPNCEAACPEI